MISTASRITWFGSVLAIAQFASWTSISCRQEVLRSSYMTTKAILWRGLYLIGHEYARLDFRDSAWHLEGVAVFSHDSSPCRLDYHVQCTEKWVTAAPRYSDGLVSAGLG